MVCCAKTSLHSEERSTHVLPPELSQLFPPLPFVVLSDEAGQLAWTVKHLEVDDVVNSNRASAYESPPRLNKPFSALPCVMPEDRAGKLAWAVKHLAVEKVKEILAKWPHGASSLDIAGNTLFHLAASEWSHCSPQPEGALEIVQILLQKGWSVVDAKNEQGERADDVAAKANPDGLLNQLLEARSRDFQEKLRMEQYLPLIWDESPVPWKWERALQDDQRRCFAGLFKGAFSAEKCRKWMDATLEKGNWSVIPGVPRTVAWYVSQEYADCPYRYSGLEFPATVFPPFLLEIRKAVCELCGILPDQYPSACNVNVYDDQKHEVGWHSDDEVMFQGLSRDTCIISLSLGSPRHFCWRLQGTAAKLGTVALGDGDIMTMEGLFQKHYKHSVPKSDSPVGRRVNFTFRWIVVKAHAVDAGTQAFHERKVREP